MRLLRTGVPHFTPVISITIGIWVSSAAAFRVDQSDQPCNTHRVSASLHLSAAACDAASTSKVNGAHALCRELSKMVVTVRKELMYLQLPIFARDCGGLHSFGCNANLACRTHIFYLERRLTDCCGNFLFRQQTHSHTEREGQGKQQRY
jgi:hypothetical protein